MAFCYSATDGGAGPSRVVFSSTLQRVVNCDFRIRRFWHRCVLTTILVLAFSIPEPLGCCRGGGVYKLHGQYWRLFRAENDRQPESADGIIQFWIHLHDHVLGYCVIARAPLPKGANRALDQRAREVNSLKLFRARRSLQGAFPFEQGGV